MSFPSFNRANLTQILSNINSFIPGVEYNNHNPDNGIDLCSNRPEFQKFEYEHNKTPLDQKIKEQLDLGNPFRINLDQVLFAYLLPIDEFSKSVSQEQLTKKWIYNAIHHIFQNPLRSILELIVNGLDASQQNAETVGQFGMGFFSVLSFLYHEETEGCEISMATRYLSQKENSKIEGYIHIVNEELVVPEPVPMPQCHQLKKFYIDLLVV